MERQTVCASAPGSVQNRPVDGKAAGFKQTEQVVFIVSHSALGDICVTRTVDSVGVFEINGVLTLLRQAVLPLIEQEKRDEIADLIKNL